MCTSPARSAIVRTTRRRVYARAESSSRAVATSSRRRPASPTSQWRRSSAPRRWAFRRAGSPRRSRWRARARPDGLRRLARCRHRHARHLDVQVDAVEHRPRDSRAVALERRWRAFAAVRGIADSSRTRTGAGRAETRDPPFGGPRAPTTPRGGPVGSNGPRQREERTRPGRLIAAGPGRSTDPSISRFPVLGTQNVDTNVAG